MSYYKVVVLLDIKIEFNDYSLFCSEKYKTNIWDEIKHMEIFFGQG